MNKPIEKFVAVFLTIAVVALIVGMQYLKST